MPFTNFGSFKFCAFMFHSGAQPTKSVLRERCLIGGSATAAAAAASGSAGRPGRLYAFE